jgi:hypothetical protein
MYAGNYQPSIVVYASYQGASGYTTGIDFASSSYSNYAGGSSYSLGAGVARLQFSNQGVAYGSGYMLDMVVSSVSGGGTLKPFIRCSSGYSAGGGVLSTAPNFIQNYYPTYIGTTDVYPTSSLTVGGSLGLNYVFKTATYLITATDYLIDCTANSFTVTLPTAVGITGRIYEIVNSGAGTITIATTSSQTFANVAASPTTLTLATALGKSIRVMSNGANWIQLN